MKRRKRGILLTLKTLVNFANVANVANFLNVAKKAMLEIHTVVVGFAGLAVQMISIYDYVARQ